MGDDFAEGNLQSRSWALVGLPLPLSPPLPAPRYTVLVVSAVLKDFRVFHFSMLGIPFDPPSSCVAPALY